MPRREPWKDDDEDEENLDPVYKVLRPIYDRLLAEGVPEERHPSLESLVSHLIDWVDGNKMERWIMRYARVEKITDEDHRHEDEDKAP